MRIEASKPRLEAFMSALGQRVKGEGCVYLTGGATAVLQGWREMTIDIDLKPDPEPAGFYEAIAVLKNELEINVELACPDQFIPAIPGWRERSVFIVQKGPVRFFHYDPYGQALSKLQRRHERDMRDVHSLIKSGWVEKVRLWELFQQIEPQIIRYPAIDAATFRAVVKQFCDETE
jgi:hypothetical protein